MLGFRLWHGGIVDRFAAMGVLLGVDFFLGAEFTKQYALYVVSFKLENPYGR
jgi:hypothetical protein